MTGFFADLNTDIIENAEAVGFSDPEDGLYEFEVVGAELKKGTTKDPNALGFMVKYVLNNDSVTDKKYQEYFGVPQPADPRNPTERERQQASFLKARMVDLGIEPAKINSVTDEDLIGASGTFRIIRNAKGYTTVRDFKLGGAAAPAAPAPVVKAVARPARKAAPKASPLPADEGGPVMDHEPEAAPKARPTAVVCNPFAK